MSTAPSDSTTPTTNPHDALFQVSKPQKEVIPCPPLFLDVIQNAFGQPAALTALSALNKRLYCAAPELDTLLALPSVDAPVAQLSSTLPVSSDIMDGLKAEERKTEIGFQKAHKAAAWAVKAATVTSFFNRASLIWLHQLQESLPPDDKRIHQDINKLVAAMEYSADASLNAAKFASRSLAATVTKRRLIWLCNWKADSKAKWKLASSAFKAPDLFGSALDPILIEDKDKWKILPLFYRKQDRRYVPYTQRQPFQAFSGPIGSYSQHSFYQGTDRVTDRRSEIMPAIIPPPKSPF